VLNRLIQNSGLESLASWDAFWASWNLLIFLFLLSLGMLISLLQKSGAADAFIDLAQKKVNNKKSAEKTSLMLSLLFFIDDYFSSLTVGSIMRPLAQACSLNPVKLAFLVSTMATSLTVISPISSWIGEIVLQLRMAGIDETNANSLINADPLYAYIRSIPLIIYAFFTIVGTWYIVLRGISFGPMTYYDTTKSSQNRDTFVKKVTHASIFDFIIPISTLIISIIVGLLGSGHYWLLGGTHDLINAFKHSAANQAFFLGGITTLILSIIWLTLRKRITPHNCLQALYAGIWLILPSLIMLTHAWTLGSLLKHDLHTGSYIAHLFCYFITPTLFPVLCFLFAALIAWTIGSSWATMGLVFPIVFDMIRVVEHIALRTTLDQAPIILPIIGATLSGCIFGSHISFISDTPIMSSTSTGANHLAHIRTMTFYLIPISIGTAFAYTIIGITYGCITLYASTLIAYVVGLSITIGILEGMNWYAKKNNLASKR
jgi:Na+/H+ antiporter NhaC